ncbi:MAG: penicillin-binding protein 2 [Corynebacterium sp.]|nr:penicillin-binding protein 2 [Corynebacterium sp.]
MNKSIKLTALFTLLLTLILLVNLTIIQAFSTQKYAEHPRNPRGFYDMQTVARGQIFAGGTVLAQSTADDKGIYSRSYPVNSPAWGPVTGYLSDRYGAAQLEASYNSVLNGTADSLATRNFWKHLAGEPTPGANVEVTIDPQLQQRAYDLLAEQAYEGAAVALQPSTGKILAMASSPSYNPGTIDSQWDALQVEPGSPLLNHATQETLPPGSIFKIITTAAGLENGYGPQSELTGAPEITLPGTNTQLTNYGGQTCAGSPVVTLTTAFALSCNTAFVEMGTNVGADALRATAEAFGVGTTYDLGVDAAPGALGTLEDSAAVGQSAIGQRDVSMSALQAAVMAATVANEGKRMEPYLVNRITDTTMNDISTTRPREAAQAISPDVAAMVTDMMFASERNTYGYNGNGYASKTGTAEHGNGLPPHVWYVAFDPNRDIAVAVVVKDGGHLGTGATGGQVSSPIGRALLDAYTGEK